MNNRIKVYIRQKPYAQRAGELGQNYAPRRVVITGTATYHPNAWSSISGVTNQLRGFLVSRDGWEVTNFSIDGAGWISGQVSISIVANVPGAYSNQAHVDRAEQLLSSYRIFNTGGILDSGQVIFDNVRLSATGADLQNYTPPTQTTTTGTPQPKPRANTNTGNNGGNSYYPTAEEIASAIGNGASSAASGAQNLFGIAGLTTMGVTAILIAVVLIKNR